MILDVVLYTKMQLDEAMISEPLLGDSHVPNIRCEVTSKCKHDEAYCMGQCLINMQKVWNGKVLAVLLDDGICKASLG